MLISLTHRTGQYIQLFMWECNDEQREQHQYEFFGQSQVVALQANCQWWSTAISTAVSVWQFWPTGRHFCATTHVVSYFAWFRKVWYSVRCLATFERSAPISAIGNYCRFLVQLIKLIGVRYLTNLQLLVLWRVLLRAAHKCWQLYEPFRNKMGNPQLWPIPGAHVIGGSSWKYFCWINNIWCLTKRW